MKITEVVHLDSTAKAKAWIEKVYKQTPRNPINPRQHMMVYDNGEQFAMFELMPSGSMKDAVEVAWFQAYPLRQGVGSRAMKELQALAQQDGIGLTLFPWDKGQVSQAKLTKFYKQQGFQKSSPKGKNMFWKPQVAESDSETIKQMAQTLLGIAHSKLKFTKMPDIAFLNVPEMHNSFGNFSDGKIKVVIKNRHPMDVMRTLAHELAHYRQEELNGTPDGADGSNDENEANAFAGIVMRELGQEHPEYFNAGQLSEGGWANPITQGTKITPIVVDTALKVLKQFVPQLNEFLKSKHLAPVELGSPCGSTTYYKRDMQQNPEREYGDIDINLFIPRISGTSNNANAEIYRNAIKEFCDKSQDYQTQNGTNVIFNLDGNHIQVDFITAYYENKEWSKALAPEYNMKGVLCNSIYSSLGEALHLSIGGGHGVQAKSVNGQRVPFNQTKGVTLQTITNNPETWALDIAKYFGAKKFSPRLKAHPGMIGEPRVADMINSVRGIAETLEMNNCLPDGYSSASDLVNIVKSIYLGKMQKAIASSKFDKAATPDAILKAEKTKQMLADKSRQIATLFGN